MARRRQKYSKAEDIQIIRYVLNSGGTIGYKMFYEMENKRTGNNMFS